MIPFILLGWFGYDYVWSLVHLGQTGGGKYVMLSLLDAVILAYALWGIGQQFGGTKRK